MGNTIIQPGRRKGAMRLVQSKSHAHRVLIAEFLAGRMEMLTDAEGECEDVLATKRCLRVLSSRNDPEVELDVGESGTTRRLLGPIVAALGVKPKWVMRGKLAERPQIEYAELKPGVHELPGNVSSQFISGLLFALPILQGNSKVRLTTPLASRGYVRMTLAVLGDYGISIEEIPDGFLVTGNQQYVAPEAGPKIEPDWSGAAFLLALRELGNEVTFDFDQLNCESRQPDSAVVSIIRQMVDNRSPVVDIDECPDIFPILTVVAASLPRTIIFTGIKRLRLKESDRIAAMADVLGRFGVKLVVEENSFTVYGTGKPLDGGSFTAYGDHRIAMSIAVASTWASAPIVIDNVECAAKSYPTFFEDFMKLEVVR